MFLHICYDFMPGLTAAALISFITVNSHISEQNKAFLRAGGFICFICPSVQFPWIQVLIIFCHLMTIIKQWLNELYYFCLIFCCQVRSTCNTSFSDVVLVPRSRQQGALCLMKRLKSDDQRTIMLKLRRIICRQFYSLTVMKINDFEGICIVCLEQWKFDFHSFDFRCPSLNITK